MAASPMPPGARSTPAEAPRTIVLLQLEGTLGPAAADLVQRGLALAAREDAQLAVLQLDSTGGLDASVRSILQDILASPVPVATLVAPADARVAGAAIWLLYASPIAAMAPGATLGRPTAAPEAGGNASTDGTGPGLRAASAAGSLAQGLAQLRGRNADWPGQAMVGNAGLSAPEALQKKVVTLLARDVSDLLLQLNGRELPTPEGPRRLSTQRTQMIVFGGDWRSRLLSVIADPLMARVLLMIGICGLLLELARPGLWLPGIVGGVSATLALFGLHFLEVHAVGLGLIAVGVLLLVAQGLRPGFAVLGLAGAAAFATGATILIDEPAPGGNVPAWMVALLSAGSAIFILVATRTAARARRRATGQEGRTGVPALVGSTGEIVDFLDGEGWAQIQGDYWPVTGLGDLRAGARVQVSAVEGSVLRVTPYAIDPGESGGRY